GGDRLRRGGDVRGRGVALLWIGGDHPPQHRRRRPHSALLVVGPRRPARKQEQQRAAQAEYVRPGIDGVRRLALLGGDVMASAERLVTGRERRLAVPGARIVHIGRQRRVLGVLKQREPK